jgi:xylulokinase
LSLQWFRNQFAPGAEYDALTAEGATAPPLSNGLFWLPYLMGERTPHLDSIARGAWVGLTAKHNRADMIRAILEGVSYSMRDCLQILEQMNGEVNTVRASGGGARSAFWRQMLADILGVRLTTVENKEGSAFGAALLAMAGSGAFSSVEEACRNTVREADQLVPYPHTSAAYQRGYEVYTVLYPTLKPINGLIHQLI